MVHAISAQRTTSVPGTTVVPDPLKDEFSALIVDISVGRLARSARATKEAAKKWKEGRSMPSSEKLLNMAMDIRPVRSWVLTRLGAIDAASPQVMNTLFAALYQVAHQPGPDGEAARAVIQRANTGAPK